MLSEKLRPKSVAAMIGNESARLDLVKWLKHWKIGSKAIMLTGPPGIGKSTSIYAVARELGYTVIELNASDARTKERLKEEIGPALENASIFGEEKLLIFLDEIDGLSGRNDYAGMDYVLDFIENATMPVALAANLEDTQKLRKIEQKSLVVRFKPIEPDMMLLYLKNVNLREELNVPYEALLQVARNSRGDVRQALNSMQTLQGGKVTGAQTDHQFMSDLLALDAVLSADNFERAISLFRQYDASPFDKIRSIFDAVVAAKNLSIESKSESLELVAKADILLRRINLEQSWRLLRYFDKYLAFATVGKELKRVDSSVPWNLKLAIWNDGKVIKAINAELSEICRVGSSTFAAFHLPYLVQYFKIRQDEFEGFLKRHGFEESERRVLMKLMGKK
ncbi:MAG: AAA family ATPase [Nitrososphaerota archaeon]|nr:AAA family ATPase [Nitrososphaerota archaeon]